MRKLVKIDLIKSNGKPKSGKFFMEENNNDTFFYEEDRFGFFDLLNPRWVRNFKVLIKETI